MNNKESMGKRLFSPRIPFKWSMMLPLLILMAIILAYPLIHSVWITFRNVEMLKPSQNDFVGLSQFSKVLYEPLFWIAVKNTFTFLLIAVPLELALGLALAIALKKQKRFSNLTRAILLTPIFVTPVAVGLMFRFLLNTQLGLIPIMLGRLGIHVDFFGTKTALLSIAMIDVWQWTPFMMLMLLAGLESLPKEPYEAAQVEGANSWQIFTRITIPLLKPVIVVAVLIRSLDALRVFEYVYVITGGGPGTSTETLQYYIYKVGFGFYRLSEAAASAWIVVIIVMFLVVVFLWRTTKGESR